MTKYTKPIQQQIEAFNALNLRKFIEHCDNTIASTNTNTLLRSRYNVSKSEMHSLLINAFHIPIEISSVACKQYFTRKWINACDLSYRTIKEGVYTYKDTPYLVVYHNCTPYQVHKALYIMCSFREAQDEFNLPAYMLIKILPTEGE